MPGDSTDLFPWLKAVRGQPGPEGASDAPTYSGWELERRNYEQWRTQQQQQPRGKSCPTCGQPTQVPVPREQTHAAETVDLSHQAPKHLKDSPARVPRYVLALVPIMVGVLVAGGVLWARGNDSEPASVPATSTPSTTAPPAQGAGAVTSSTGAAARSTLTGTDAPTSTPPPDAPVPERAREPVSVVFTDANHDGHDDAHPAAAPTTTTTPEKTAPATTATDTPGFSARAFGCAVGEFTIALGLQTNVTGTALCMEGPRGVLPAPDKTPATRIFQPEDGAMLPVGQDFDVVVKYRNFEPGLFDDPASQYGLRPFSVNAKGHAQGHSHVYVQRLEDGQVPDNSREVDAFLALNGTDEDGNGLSRDATLSGTVPGEGLDEPGTYRICVDIAGGNHLTFPKGVARFGPQVDCIQVTFK